jgi:DNA-binding PadR family transcriptional regulator
VQRVTGPTTRVLRFLLGAEEAVWGLQLCKATGLASGTVYPMLARLEAYGWIEATWDDSSAAGPRRRLYSLTNDGRFEIEKVLEVQRRPQKTKPLTALGESLA